MNALRAAALLLACTAAAGLVLGTVGFSAMSADRGVDAHVTDDEHASLGYGPLSDAATDGEPEAVVEYRNRLGGDLDTVRVDVAIAAPEDTETTVADVDAPDRLDMGTSRSVDVTLRCPAEETVDLRFAVSGNGSGVSVSMDRVHTVTCTPTGVSGDDPDTAAP